MQRKWATLISNRDTKWRSYTERERVMWDDDFPLFFIIATMMMMRDALVQDTIRDKDEILYERRNLFL